MLLYVGGKVIYPGNFSFVVLTGNIAVTFYHNDFFLMLPLF